MPGSFLRSVSCDKELSKVSSFQTFLSDLTLSFLRLWYLCILLVLHTTGDPAEYRFFVSVLMASTSPDEFHLVCTVPPRLCSRPEGVRHNILISIFANGKAGFINLTNRPLQLALPTLPLATAATLLYTTCAVRPYQPSLYCVFRPLEVVINHGLPLSF